MKNRLSSAINRAVKNLGECLERHIHPFLDMAFDNPAYMAVKMYKGIKGLPEKNDKEIFDCITGIVTEYHLRQGMSPADMFMRGLENELAADGYVRIPGQVMNENKFEMPEPDISPVLKQIYREMNLRN